MKGMKVRSIMKKNQLVLTVLAIVVAVAGYITFLGRQPKEIARQSDDVGESVSATDIFSADDLVGEVSENDIIAENNAMKEALKNQNTSADETTAHPGEAILTSGMTVSNYLAQTKLKREQARGVNKAALLEIIDSDTVDEAQKQAAIDSMVTLTTLMEKENAAETMLSTKGFDDAIVSISGGKVDVVICRNAISLSEKAQIEDIIKRKTEYGIENIVISLMEVTETGNADPASAQNE